MSDSILVKTTLGAGWAIGWRILTRLLGFFSTLALARLLVPEDFGLVAIATGFSQGILAFSQLGVEEALIRHKTAERAVYDTAFTINLIRGLATAGIVAACAWPVALFFNDPRLMPVLFALAACSMVTAFGNVGTIEFLRDFAFSREFMLLLLPRLLAVCVTISVALATHSHWALVAGIATSQILGTVMGYVMHPYRPHLSLAAWHELSSFSIWSWATSVAVMVRDRVDSFVIGRILGISQVGIYSVGAELATMPTYELAGPLARACFPSFAAAVRAGLDSTAAYLRILSSAMLVLLPAAAGISLVAGPVVVIALGSSWLAAADVMRVLGGAGAALVFGTVTSTFLSAHGILRPGFVIVLVSMGIRAVGALILVNLFGLVGAAAAHALTIIVENVAYVVVAFRRFGIPLSAFFGGVWRGMLATVAMIVVLLVTGLGSDTHAPVKSLVAGVATGAAVYVLVLLALWTACGRPDGAEADLLTLARRVLWEQGLARLTRRRAGQ